MALGFLAYSCPGTQAFLDSSCIGVLHFCSTQLHRVVRTRVHISRGLLALLIGILSQVLKASASPVSLGFSQVKLYLVEDCSLSLTTSIHSVRVIGLGHCLMHCTSSGSKSPSLNAAIVPCWSCPHPALFRRFSNWTI